MHPFSSFASSLLGLGLLQTTLVVAAKPLSLRARDHPASLWTAPSIRGLTKRGEPGKQPDPKPGNKAGNKAGNKPDQKPGNKAGKTPGQTPGKTTKGPTQVNDKLKNDISVLLGFKAQVTEDPTGCTSNWKPDVDIAQWKNVEIDVEPKSKLLRVSLIDFNDCYLAGSHMHLDGFLDQLTGLAVFHANSNNFTGPVPDLSIRAMPFLYEFDLSTNKLSPAEFPHSLLEQELTYLDIRYNSFHGVIPDVLFSPSDPNTKNLDAVLLSGNQFTGTVPANIGQSGAIFLGLEENQLTGPFPAKIVEMKNLVKAWLGTNKLTGPLPANLGQLRYLSVFTANDNQLTGPLPESMGNLQNITIFDVSNNQLTGKIPASTANLKEATALYFGNNRLTGPIPEGLCMLPQLLELVLTDNCFDGPLPPACKDLQARLKADKKGGVVDFTNRPDCHTKL